MKCYPYSGSCRNNIIAFPVARKRLQKKDGARGLGSPSSVITFSILRIDRGKRKGKVFLNPKCLVLDSLLIRI